MWEALQYTVSIRTIAFTQVDWGDLVQHLAKCSAAMQQWSVRRFFTGWISRSCTTTDFWAISLNSETNKTAISPFPFHFTTASTPPLPALLLYTHSLTPHKSISAKLQVLPTPTPERVFLMKGCLCRFLSSQTQRDAYRLFWALCERIWLYCHATSLQLHFKTRLLQLS